MENMDEHWLVKAVDRYHEAKKHKNNCCATMHLNIYAHDGVPEWVSKLGQCPWCKTKIKGEN